ncbi:MAG TPA: A/G-specific adenine glycosylase [Thermoanaerobaculia bacterium]|nr:A/G-specific adenine glycosylase [Thermoanaerobaculia bacterium]
MQPADRLLAWYDRHRRDLPWRRSRDPYCIWLSEVMLQQTRVEAVVPFYERFVARFPTVEELARAPLDEVLALWSGLGYYRRARQLHAAAQRVAAAGGFPRTYEGLLDLPGIGPYTAAAVASIAFGAAIPVLDGNVARVLSRVLAQAGDPSGRTARRRLLAAAAGLLVAGRAGDSNQALMELGATLCLPRQPRCPRCPLRGGCLGALEGAPERYPAARRRRRPERLRLLVAVVERQGRVLLFRRPDASAVLAGTWELPWVEWGGGEEAARALADKYGGVWRLGAAAGEVRHGITYRDLAVAVHRAELEGSGEVREGAEAAWVDALAGLPLSSLVRKVMAVFKAAP